MNGKLLKLLERVELDRPILMHEKVDIIWSSPPPSSRITTLLPALEDESIVQVRLNSPTSTRSKAIDFHKVSEQKRLKKHERSAKNTK